MTRNGLIHGVLPVLILGLLAAAGSAGAAPRTTGQDSYGYRFIDSEETGGPTMNFEDISSTGSQAIGSGVDDSAVSVPMGMTFPFYGTSYTTAFVSSNGNVHFGSANSSYSNTTLPTTGGPRPMVAAFWDDLTTGTSGSVRTQLLTAGGNRFIVQWTNVQHLGDAGTVLTFQIKLYDTGLIVVNYQSLSSGGLYSNGSSATTGIQNAAGSVGLQYQANGVPPANNLYSGLVIHYSMGQPPGSPNGLVQSGTSAGAPESPGYLSDASMYFRGAATDPDTGDRVRIEVEIVNATQPFSPTGTTGVLVQSPLVDSGATAEASYTFTGTPYGTGDYHWRARSVDNFGNRSDWTVFDPSAVHFTVDISPPGMVQLHSPPNNSSAGIHPPPTGRVGFEWQSAVDAGPPGPILYDCEVAKDAAFTDLVASTTTGDLFCFFDLSISEQPYFWRVRATDQMGNVGAWSLPWRFYVVDDNGLSKAAGDGIGPGCSARAGSGGSVAGLLAVMMLAALGMRRRGLGGIHHHRPDPPGTPGVGPAPLTLLRRSLRRVLPALILSAVPWTPAAQAQQAGPGTWTARQAMPMSRYYHAAAALDGSLYVYAGLAYTSVNSPLLNYQHTALRYDFVTNAWVTLPGIPASAGNVWNGWQLPFGAAFGGEIYQFGGNAITLPVGATAASTPVPSAAVWRFNPAGSTWTQLADMPVALVSARAAVTSAKIHVTGGYASTGPTTATFEFDPVVGSWTTGPALPTAVFGHYTGADAAGRIYVAGGQTTSTPTGFGTRIGSTWCLDPANAAAGWVARAAMPAANAHGTYAMANGRLYCVGGAASTLANYEYNPVRNAWASRISALASHQYGAGAMVLGANAAGNPWPKVYCTGGSSNNTRNDEYEPPDYGLPPDEPYGLFQRRPGGPNLPEGSWINTTTIEVGAIITDPNADQVRLEAEIIGAGASYTGTPNTTGAQGNEGTCTAQRSGLAEGGWKWRCRARDWNDNVSDWVEFESPSHDFNVDRTPPSAPVAVSPKGFVTVGKLEGEAIEFTWTAATDNGPSEFLYDVQLSRNPDFTAMFGSKSGLQETSTSFEVPPHRFPYFWRVRATDFSGNVGPWSNIQEFLVSFDDKRNHAAGDAERVCGFGPSGSFGPAGAALLALLAGAAGSRRRARR